MSVNSQIVELAHEGKSEEEIAGLVGRETQYVRKVIGNERLKGVEFPRPLSSGRAAEPESRPYHIQLSAPLYEMLDAAAKAERRSVSDFAGSLLQRVLSDRAIAHQRSTS